MLYIDPIYETFEECEGMMDINDLPPPPPELLAGLDKEGAAGKKGKPPPPPPKRNKDTQLTVQWYNEESAILGVCV